MYGLSNLLRWILDRGLKEQNLITVDVEGSEWEDSWKVQAYSGAGAASAVQTLVKGGQKETE